MTTLNLEALSIQCDADKSLAWLFHPDNSYQIREYSIEMLIRDYESASKFGRTRDFFDRLYGQARLIATVLGKNNDADVQVQLANPLSEEECAQLEHSLQLYDAIYKAYQKSVLSTNSKSEPTVFFS